MSENMTVKQRLMSAENSFSPGFIDAHIHLESSMVTPAEFAKAVVAHGTTTVITDPHEITNVMGIDGVEYMIQASQNLPIDVHFMMPSCVPATEIDESGAELDCKDIDLYLDNKKGTRTCRDDELCRCYQRR